MITTVNDFKKLNNSTNEGHNNTRSLTEKAHDLYNMFNTLMLLLDEGYINDDIKLKDGLSVDDVNAEMIEQGDTPFDSEQDLTNFLNSCVTVLNIF